ISSIRRFVIVKVNRRQHFVLACAITSYGGRGVIIPGCAPKEHTIVYLKGSQPKYTLGEWERGMTRDPIAIEPADPGEFWKPSMRVRLGKIYSIE
ncbi:hypothetical protein GQ44DRAFT_782720, partial [Phaeosphaeriaceae sp. PMI808]